MRKHIKPISKGQEEMSTEELLDLIITLLTVLGPILISLKGSDDEVVEA